MLIVHLTSPYIPYRKKVFVPPVEIKIAADGWSERYTMDGAPYYHNTRTEEVSWNCPESLKDTEELQSEVGERL